jgi:ubiquitin carboxyl-terminal hydrolase 25
VPLLNSSGKSMDEDKLTDDDLKRHRVGGRLVTRKEILRSKKCLYCCLFQLGYLLISS